MKIIQITDTHFSALKPHFNGNWEPLRQWIEDQKPDLVIHTGDLSVDGAGYEEDIIFAADLIRQLSVPVLLVPGNHDVGHFCAPTQPVTTDRLDRWRRLVGPDRWFEDRAEWRLIGLNSLLVGLNDEEDAAQMTWFEEALASREQRRVAIFAHKPLFVDDPLEGETGYWGVPQALRRHFFDLMRQNEVMLFASGHLHWSWAGNHEALSLVWAPPASFILGDLERVMPGERLVGAAVHELGEKVESRLVSVPGLIPYLLDDVVEEVYPQAAKKVAAE
ncbi:metallophosphoesterase [Rhizobium sp. LC145]|uniref:metallophosphoesterase family protein n=1 Tax=Rhizobium sp. LC145 TaxID=1120688 RepID=UPI000629EB72|nr:metallophosphoesterase [Rhizobium sp. LC145]KKX33017.1 metallophosphoesterase [Rhizobium sp. LC145]TKT55955.1 metallophosphoesterase [Rhizobiaceae bacterium LC148]